MSTILHNLSSYDKSNKTNDDDDAVSVVVDNDDDNDTTTDEFLFSPKSSIDISRELLDYSHLSDSFVLEQKRSHQPPRRLFDDDDDDDIIGEEDEGGEEEEDVEGILHQSTSSMFFMSMSHSLLDAETSFESCSGVDTSFESFGVHEDDNIL